MKTDNTINQEIQCKTRKNSHSITLLYATAGMMILSLTLLQISLVRHRLDVMNSAEESPLSRMTTLRSSSKRLLKTAKKRDDALVIRNKPLLLPWNVAQKTRQPAPVVPVDASYVYNPSVLELSDGSHIFSGRMSWLYGGGCHLFQDLQDPLSMYNCLRTHMERFTDQTILGRYLPSSGELLVTSPSNGHDQNVQEFNPQISDVASWNGGPGWFDTRLIYPYSHRYPLNNKGREKQNEPKIIITSQNTELLGYDDWHELEGTSTLGLQLTYISTLHPADLISEPKEGSAILNGKQMTRWLFYDAEIEREEFDRRNKGLGWMPITADVARLKCKQRPSGLTQLPFDPEKSSMHRSPHVDDSHRRLAALEGDDWFMIKDKNWAPFVYQEKILWSYSIEPHVVCENDIDISHTDEKDVDCVLCIAKYNSSSTEVFKTFYGNIKDQGYDNVVSHLNGAPSYYIEEKNVYLGLLHVIKMTYGTDAVGRPEKKRIYEHHFYVTEAEAPFRVLAIAPQRVPLQRSRCWSPWFKTDDIVESEFAMYMQYHPDRPGREIVISYGDGDRYARVDTFSMTQVWKTFDKDTFSSSTS